MSGLLASLGVVTHASIRQELADAPGISAWANIDPRLSIGEKMMSVDEVARRGSTPAADLLGSIMQDSGALPLRPEPFLVSAIDASAKGQANRAESLLLAARSRDPRSVPTRYFLAEQYRVAGDYHRALAEIAIMLRLRSGAERNFAPYFAQLALDPAAREAVGALMERDPAMGRQVLAYMANGGVEPDLVLSLARRLPRGPDNRVWQSNLVKAAVSRGDLAKARTLWVRIVGAPGPLPLLRNPEFAPDLAPLPFAWSYESSPDGVAEEDGQGGLTVLFYGRSQVTLAEQMLALPAGRYRLSWSSSKATGDVDAVHWRVTCPGYPQAVAEAGLAARELHFAMPSDCRYPVLSLVGAENSLDAVSVSIANLKLVSWP